MHKSMINYVAIVCEVFRCGGLWLVKPLRRISADFVLPRFVHLLYVSAAKLGRMCSVSRDPVHLESVSMKRIRRNKNILLFFPSSVAFPKSNLFDVFEFFFTLPVPEYLVSLVVPDWTCLTCCMCLLLIAIVIEFAAELVRCASKPAAGRQNGSNQPPNMRFRFLSPFLAQCFFQLR